MRLLRAQERERASTAVLAAGESGAFSSSSESIELKRGKAEKGSQAIAKLPPHTHGSAALWSVLCPQWPPREGSVPSGRSGWRGESACWLRFASKWGRVELIFEKKVSSSVFFFSSSG